LKNRNYKVKYRKNYEKINFSKYNDLFYNLMIMAPIRKEEEIQKYPNINFIEGWRFI